MTLFIILGVFVLLLAIFSLGLKSLFYNCAPNEVLIFSGGDRKVDKSVVRYRLVKGGFGVRVPLLERVDRLDLTNMIIELSATGAYTKGGIPLNVTGVANVKIAGHEPDINYAIERFLGKTRAELMGIAKATLEGSLRGVLATMTPEQINQDRTLFSERLVQEVEQDMNAMGLIVDTLKIQNVSDDVHYLDSIGRNRNAELTSTARIAEAIAKADSAVAGATNREIEVRAQIEAQTSIAKANAERQLADTVSKRGAVIAEEKATVAAQLAKAVAETEVQRARVEQVRRQLDAEVVQPAKAACEAAENKARATVAPIIQDGIARAEAFRKVADVWKTSGDSAREILILQKIEPIIRQVAGLMEGTNVQKVTLIDSKGGNSKSGLDMTNLLGLNEQAKQLFGIDLIEKLKEFPKPAKTEIVVNNTLPKASDPSP
jgi:flotillin